MIVLELAPLTLRKERRQQNPRNSKFPQIIATPPDPPPPVGEGGVSVMAQVRGEFVPLLCRPTVASLACRPSTTTKK